MAEMETGYAAGGALGQDDGAHPSVMQKGKEKVAEVGETAKRRVMENLDGRKASIVSGLEELAGNLEKLGDGPQAKLAQQAAQYVRRAEEMLNQRSASDMIDMAVQELKRRPGALIAGAFALGFVGSRLLKS
jgi:hypothetical protein